MKDIAIVGAGPAGYSAAITARKRDKSVVVIGQNTGWLAHAHSIANYPGLPDISGHDLLEAMKKQAQDLARSFAPASSIRLSRWAARSPFRSARILSRLSVSSSARAQSSPSWLPGESELLGRGVSYCGTCDGMFYRGKRVAVIAQGPEAVSEANFLAGLCSEVVYFGAKKRTRLTTESPSAAKNRKRFSAKAPPPV